MAWLSKFSLEKWFSISQGKLSVDQIIKVYRFIPSDQNLHINIKTKLRLNFSFYNSGYNTSSIKTKNGSYWYKSYNLYLTDCLHDHKSRVGDNI